GAPGVSVNGYADFLNSGMLDGPATTLHFSDTLSKSVGRHSLKMGGQADHYSIDNYQPNDVVGNFHFTGSVTGNAFSDFLFGVMNKGSVQVQTKFVSSRAWYYYLFLHDVHNYTPKLTLKTGLRCLYTPS